MFTQAFRLDGAIRAVTWTDPSPGAIRVIEIDGIPASWWEYRVQSAAKLACAQRMAEIGEHAHEPDA